MLQCAARGWRGVNLHGGGNGYYTPIAGAPSTGFTRRPEYFGIKFAQHFVGARFVTSSLNNASPLFEAFVLEQSGKLQLALINKTDTTMSCTLPAGVVAAARLLLSAPAIDSKGVRLSAMNSKHYRNVAVAAPYTGTVFELKGAKPTPHETED